MTSTTPFDRLQHFGYVLLPGVFDARDTDLLAGRLSAALQANEPSVLRSRGHTYGSRDLVRLLPEVCDIPRHSSLKVFIAAVLGSRAGLVRAMYFDKPPDRSWSLPWHKDRTIAVKNNDKPTNHFCRPTIKSGIPHVEAPESLLMDMLTIRVHLDAMTAENGPLSVMPGSHIAGRKPAVLPVELHAGVGDVLAMRPLLSHSSSAPWVGTNMHRRVIHLELAPCVELPDGYEWHSFNLVS
jgi:hypothetical protein